MDAKLALGSLLLHLLIILLLGDCNGEVADMRIEQVHSSSHMHHTDPSLIVFFMEDDLKEGNTIPVYFPKRRKLDSHLLPKEEADSIPFSSQHLQYLLRLFSFPQGSPQATAMDNTLRQCATAPIEGETKTCATSWESMLEFTTSILGSQTPIQVLSTTHTQTPSNSADSLVRKYAVTGIHEIPAPKMVACHTMPYPYAVFYCHYQESQSRVYRVSLDGSAEYHDDKVEAIAVCHMDTSHWSRKHVAFKVLGIEPGTAPVCHFFPADNFVCVSS